MLEILDYLKARYMGEKAQGMTEYAIVLALVVVIAIAVMGTNKDTGLGKVISDVFTTVGTKITTAINGVSTTGN